MDYVVQALHIHMCVCVCMCVCACVCVCVCVCVHVCVYIHYRVATINRLLLIICLFLQNIVSFIGLFCKRGL